MARSKEHAISAQAYARMPQGDFLDELVRGRVVCEPLPGSRHGRVAATITYILMRWARATRSGVVYCETGFLLARDPDTVRGPDVAWVADGGQSLGSEGFIVGAPDLAVEVLSPGNRTGAMREKVADYLGAGARAVWVVDAVGKTLAVHGECGPAILRDGDTLTMRDLLPGFSVRVGDFFA